MKRAFELGEVVATIADSKLALLAGAENKESMLFFVALRDARQQPAAPKMAGLPQG